MTPGNNGASTPEDDDPFGYLYADGQANGAQPPSGGGYGYPNSVNRVRAVGERQYGQPQQPQQQTAQYGQYGQPPTVPQQQGGYGQPNAHYAAPENFGAGGPSTGRQPAQGGGGGRSRARSSRFTSMPAASMSVAAPCRRSCSRTGGRSEAATRRSKRSVTFPGWSQEPSSWVKTMPVSTQADLHSWRSASCCSRNRISVS